MRSRIWLVIGIIVAVAGFAGYWASRNRLDTKDADHKLAVWAEDNVAPVKRVDCPDAKLTKGARFECKVEFESGKTYALAVEVRDDEGTVEYSWTKPIAGAEKLATSLASAIKTQQGKDVKLDCGQGIVEIPPDGLLCAATAGGQTGHLRVKFDAAAKQVVWTVEP